MILLEDKKSVIITPPHTGSGSLHRQLCGKPNRYWIIAPSFADHPDHHCYPTFGTSPQPSWVLDDDYQVYVVHRNPLHRIAGLYNHLNWWLEGIGQETKTIFEFRDELQDLHWIFNKSIYQICQDLEKELHVELRQFAGYKLLSYERLGSDIYKEFDISIDWEVNENNDQSFLISQCFDPSHYFWKDEHMMRDKERWVSYEEDGYARRRFL